MMNKDANEPIDALLRLSTEIVSSYFQKNTVAPTEIVSIINDVHTALQRLSGQSPNADSIPVSVSNKKPAPNKIKNSISPDYITCLEDGKKLKTLKRYLRTHFDMSPEQYREKWGLSPDYPMVAPNYAARRSQLAKEIGLGNHRSRKSKRSRSAVKTLSR